MVRDVKYNNGMQEVPSITPVNTMPRRPVNQKLFPAIVVFLSANQFYLSSSSVWLCGAPRWQQVDRKRAAEPAGVWKGWAAGEVRQPPRGRLYPVLGLWNLASGFL